MISGLETISHGAERASWIPDALVARLASGSIGCSASRTGTVTEDELACVSSLLPSDPYPLSQIGKSRIGSQWVKLRLNS